MRVLFTSTRGAGHLRPLLPYLQAFKRRGHEVCVSAPESVSETLQIAEMPHSPFGHPGDEQLGTIWKKLRGLSKDEANALAIREIFAGLNARAALPRLLETIHNWQPDLVVRESAEMAAVIAAEQAGVPHSRVAVHNDNTEEKFLLFAAGPVDALRENAGLNPDNGTALNREPVFTSFPASLADSTLCTTGQAPFRVREPQDHLHPYSTHPDWVPQAKSPIIYLTFGSIAASTPETHTVYRAALQAVATLPIKALLTTGIGMDTSKLGEIPENVTIREWVQQGEIWPHINALVCHGGSGTILGGLAAGIPMVVAPLFADQPDNAKRIEHSGAGIAVFEPDVSAFQAAIQKVLEDTNFQANAKRIQKEMDALPDINDAIDALIAMPSSSG